MEDEIDLFDLLYTFWKKRILLITLGFIGGCIGLIYTLFIIPKEYKSTVTLILPRSNSEVILQREVIDEGLVTLDASLNQKLITTFSEIVKSRKIANIVIEKFQIEKPYEKFREDYWVSSVKGTDIVRVGVTTDNAELSRDIANELVALATAELKKLYNDLDTVYNVENITVIDEAIAEDEPIDISHTTNVITFAVIFFVIGAAVIFVQYYFDSSIKNEETIRESVELPVLATIPLMNKKKGKDND